MTLSIRRFRPEDVPAIDRLNQRLAANGVPHRVYPEATSPSPDSSPPKSRISRLLVAEAGGEIHGGVWVMEQGFWIGGSLVPAGWVKYPVAESLIDPAYNGVPGGLLVQLAREQPRLLALGMGGHGGPLAKLLAGMKWAGVTVPFLFRIVHPHRVLRELSYLRTTRLRRLVLDLMAYSGLGWAGHRLMLAARSLFQPAPRRDFTVERVDEFGSWADVIWDGCRDQYGFVATRDRRQLNQIYPPNLPGLARLRLRREGRDIGWICVLRLDLRSGQDTRYFGRLAVGVVADGLADPRDAPAALAAGTAHLLAADVDIIVGNFSHPTWRAAARTLGFFEGPSNFAFYCSPAVAALLATHAVQAKGVHVTRGDCDGPKWV